MIDLSWYRRAVVVISVAVFFTNFADYSQKFGIIPLYWIVFLMGLSAPLILPAIKELRVQIPPLVIWAAGYLLISIFWYFPSVQTADSLQDLQTRILAMVVLIMALFLYARPEEQHLARVAIGFAVLLAVALNIYELFNPLTFSDIPGRSSGLYSNVNQSGAALMLGMIVAYDVVPQKMKMLFIALTAVGIITTFSRAAILGWILVVLYFAFRSGMGIAQLRRIFLLCIVVFGFLVSPLWSNLQSTLEERGTLTLDVVQRLNFIGGDGDTTDASSRERAAVAEYAWRLFSERPLTGFGTGQHRQLAEFEVSTHNVYLAQMVDHGIIGLFILPLMIAAALWGLRKTEYDLALPFAMFLSLWGLFSHNVMEERYILVSIALIGAIVASNRVRRAEPAVELHTVTLPMGLPA